MMAAAALAALLLSGCVGSDDTLGSLLIAPGKFDIYKCPQLAQSIRSTAGRIRELEGLMTKAETGAAGQLVSATVYQPDYLATRGELNELHRAARAKHCDVSDLAVAPALPKRARKATTH